MLYGAGPLLFAAVAGYWVLERAEKHKGNLQRVGQVLGWAIILISLTGVACRVWSSATCASVGKGRGGYCPMSLFQSSTPTQAP